jgi:hypothetical protein
MMNSKQNISGEDHGQWYIVKDAPSGAITFLLQMSSVCKTISKIEDCHMAPCLQIEKNIAGLLKVPTPKKELTAADGGLS